MTPSQAAQVSKQDHEAEDAEKQRLKDKLQEQANSELEDILATPYCEWPSVPNGADELFLKWFEQHGGTHPKVGYPVEINGMRSAVALEDISPGELTCTVPKELMISPVHCRQSKTIGHVFRENYSLLRQDDPSITLMLMHEKLKGDQSFWFPFLQMMPHPETISEWTDTDLDELQDPALKRDARERYRRLARSYARIFGVLCYKYPDLFPSHKYTFKLYRWAWNQIQVCVNMIQRPTHKHGPTHFAQNTGTRIWSQTPLDCNGTIFLLACVNEYQNAWLTLLRGLGGDGGEGGGEAWALDIFRNRLS
jgi:hypothetical protein